MARIGRAETRYRSPGLPAGALRKLDGIHVHVDGGGAHDLVLSIVQELEREGRPSKLTAISRSVAGPERKQHPETYASHTPPGGEEGLEYFSTTAIDNREDGIQVLTGLLPRVRDRAGSVVEVEHVVATVENGTWSQVGLDDLQVYRDEEVGFRKGASLPFEIHHAFDTPRLAAPRFDLRQLLAETTRLGILVGGWFSFDRGKGDQSFRSNGFRNKPALREQVLREQEILVGYLNKQGVEFRLWTIVEQVLGIWHSPLTSVRE